MRDLAAKTGLSIGTISLALRHSPLIPPGTRKRVLDAAERIGYRSSALVSALMQQVRCRSRIKPTGEVVAYLHAGDHGGGEEAWKGTPSLFFQYTGAHGRAAELGFDLQTMWLGRAGVNSRQVARMMYARGVRGALLAPLAFNHKTLHLDWDRHSIVAIGYSFRQLALNRAAHHHLAIMLSCYLNLRKLGHRRIGMVMPCDADMRVRHAWVSGFLGSQRVYGGDTFAPLLQEDMHDRKGFLRWFRRARPDAIIGCWNTLYLDWLHEMGVDVPGEVSYASLDVGEERIGRLAGMLQDNRGVGRVAMDLLAGRLFRNETGIPSAPTVTQVEGTWVDGPTVRRRPAS